MRQPSILFKIQRLLYIWKGIGKYENEHFLFKLGYSLSDFEVYRRLANFSWQPNHAGYIYKDQIYQVRKLVNSGQHQYHARFYRDGTVTGHFETALEWDLSDHLNGVDLRTMNSREAKQLQKQLVGY